MMHTRTKDSEEKKKRILENSVHSPIDTNNTRLELESPWQSSNFSESSPFSAMSSFSPLHSKDYKSVSEAFRENSYSRFTPSPRFRSSPVLPIKPIKPTLAFTHSIISTYRKCNQDFKYELQYNPKRVLTKPCKPTCNDGYDNDNNDLILYVNSIIGTEEGQRFVVIDMLGQGTFGQVVRCQNLKTRELVAIKVIKGKPAYFNQSMMEIAILDELNLKVDQEGEHLILLKDRFIYHSHLCLVFELLSVSLYDLLKQNKFRGLSPHLIRVFSKQALEALCRLSEAHIIHCDLKPENILLKNLDSPDIKIIDFGSACHDHLAIHTYIQSRFYRSPEVILGLPYSSSIDMWSIGCIMIEMFLGLPLFPGSSEYNQLARIIEALGMPPLYMIEFGKNGSIFFNKSILENGGRVYELKPLEQYSNEQKTEEKPSKRYLPKSSIKDLIYSYPIFKTNANPSEVEKEMECRYKFIDFIEGLLNLNPFERWSPQQAKLHPFITGERLVGKFKPPTTAARHQQLRSPVMINGALGLVQKSRSPNFGNVPSSQPLAVVNSPTLAPALKTRGRLRSNTVNATPKNLVPVSIQRAAAVANSGHHNPSQLSNGRASVEGSSDKQKKRYSMPMSPVSPKDGNVDLQFSMLEAGILGLKIEDRSAKPLFNPHQFSFQPIYKDQHAKLTHVSSHLPASSIHLDLESQVLRSKLNRSKEKISNFRNTSSLPQFSAYHNSSNAPQYHSTGEKSRRTYSFGSEGLHGIQYQPIFNALSEHPSSLPNSYRPVYQTRSASYSSTINQSTYSPSSSSSTLRPGQPPRFKSLSSIPTNYPIEFAQPTRGSLHRPAYLDGNHPNAPQNTGLSNQSRRYTTGSSTNSYPLYEK